VSLKASPPSPDTVRRPGSAFFPGIEGLRAVAALMVLLVHVAFVSGVSTGPGAAGAFTARAEVGVGVFFVISGFLLYRPFALAHLTGTATPATGRFLLRRLCRILPLYWAALTLTVLLIPASRPKDGLDALLLPALGQVYRGQTVYLGVPQAWSLCVEVLFYVSLPVYAAVVGRRATLSVVPERVEWAGIGALYLGGLVVRALLELTSPVPWRVWHGFLPVWFDLFAAGFGLAVLSARWTRAGGVPARLRGPRLAAGCWAGAVVVYVVLARGIGLGRDPLYERGTGQALAEEILWGLFALLLVLPAVAGTPRLLALRPVALLGLVSYGIYLWHQLAVETVLAHSSWPPFRAPFALLLVVVLAATVGTAVLSYRYVERPGITLGRRFGSRRPGG
jgi:peptidoglycan/LPS O-acetylase OafA/YrhL